MEEIYDINEKMSEIYDIKNELMKRVNILYDERDKYLLIKHPRIYAIVDSGTRLIGKFIDYYLTYEEAIKDDFYIKYKEAANIIVFKSNDINIWQKSSFGDKLLSEPDIMKINNKIIDLGKEITIKEWEIKSLEEEQVTKYNGIKDNFCKLHPLTYIVFNRVAGVKIGYFFTFEEADNEIIKHGKNTSREEVILIKQTSSLTLSEVLRIPTKLKI